MQNNCVFLKLELTLLYIYTAYLMIPDTRVCNIYLTIQMRSIHLLRNSMELNLAMKFRDLKRFTHILLGKHLMSELCKQFDKKLTWVIPIVCGPYEHDEQSMNVISGFMTETGAESKKLPFHAVVSLMQFFNSSLIAKLSKFALEVTQQEPVLEIKQKIERVLGVPVASQTLAIWGWELINGLDMEDYPIVTEGTKINLTINPILQNLSKMQITVKFSAKKITIEVDRSETVQSLKEKIHIMDGTPIKRMALFFSGIEMEDFRNLSEYGIREFSEIIIFLKSMSKLIADPPSKSLSVMVQTSSSLLNAASIPIDIKDTSTVSELRQMLLSSKILPVDDYIFIHKQRIMRDSCSLRWHGVANGDFLYIFKGTVSRGI
ncbi:Ubiquitin-like domain [Dillenia turbinata]|uniref:Ubiquitin-like domain n=1 Tax=Dillenia turbinata TaxID=194707 RepID=A0AAN8UNS7_9MAGN